MLNHLMMLYEDAFEKMKRGTKTIEIRLSDSMKSSLLFFQQYNFKITKLNEQ